MEVVINLVIPNKQILFIINKTRIVRNHVQKGIDMPTRTRFFRSLGLAVTAGVLALLASLPFVNDATGEGWENIAYVAALAAAISGFGWWWVLMNKPGKRPVLKGLLTGILVVVSAHLLVWYLAMLLNLSDWLQGDSFLSVLGESLTGGLVIAVLSLVVAGWVTLPLGAIAGSIVAYLQFRRSSPVEPTAEPSLDNSIHMRQD